MRLASPFSARSVTILSASALRWFGSGVVPAASGTDRSSACIMSSTETIAGTPAAWMRRTAALASAILSWLRGDFSDLGNAMNTAEIIRTDGTQAVKLPEGFQFAGDAVSIRREGEAVILEPVKPSTWPPGFFDDIRIDDRAFARPEQGSVPRAPSLD